MGSPSVRADQQSIHQRPVVRVNHSDHHVQSPGRQWVEEQFHFHLHRCRQPQPLRLKLQLIRVAAEQADVPRCARQAPQQYRGAVALAEDRRHLVRVQPVHMHLHAVQALPTLRFRPARSPRCASHHTSRNRAQFRAVHWSRVSGPDLPELQRLDPGGSGVQRDAERLGLRRPVVRLRLDREPVPCTVPRARRFRREYHVRMRPHGDQLPQVHPCRVQRVLTSRQRI